MDIERIREIAKKQGIDLAVHGLVCLPQEIKKYTRSVQRNQSRGGRATYRALIKYKDFYCSKSFKTEIEAEQYICLTNVREGFPIRNSFTVFANRVLVNLPGNKLLICNYEDLYLVETHTWCCSSNGYAVTNTSGSTNAQFFHNLVMKHIPTEITVDHINRNGLDNRKSNLRLVDRRIQSINQGIKSNNTSGVTGVSYYKKSDRWVAQWEDADGNKCKKSFGSNKYANARTRAIKHHQKMIRELPHYREALCLDDAEAQ